jgi:hypothetical protein
MLMKAKVRALIEERDGVRGLVPSRHFGIRDKVYGTYLTKLDPRANPVVQHALAESEDPRFKEFLERIQEKRYRRMALQTIAKGCNITLAEFGSWFNKASTQAAIAKAQMGSLRIVEDMVEDAKTIQAVCDRCDGMTWVSAPSGLPKETPGYRSMVGDGGVVLWIRDCPVCNKGKVRKPGDSHARDRTLEMAGLLKKGPGVVINQNFGASHASAVSDLDDCMTMDATFEGS